MHKPDFLDGAQTTRGYSSSVARERDAGSAYQQRSLAEFIRQAEPHLLAADAEMHDLTNGTIGKAYWDDAARRLRTGSPTADPIRDLRVCQLARQ